MPDFKFQPSSGNTQVQQACATCTDLPLRQVFYAQNTPSDSAANTSGVTTQTGDAYKLFYDAQGTDPFPPNSGDKITNSAGVNPGIGNSNSGIYSWVKIDLEIRQWVGISLNPGVLPTHAVKLQNSGNVYVILQRVTV